MKKGVKIILTILVICMLCACGKKERNEEEVINPNAVTLNGITYVLEQDDSEYGLNYKVASNFRKTNTGNAINYFSEKVDGSEYFVFRIFHYDNKDIEYAIKDTTTEYDNRREETINGITYTVVHFTNFNNANTNLYYYTSNNTTYAFCFTSHIDISKLVEVFLSNVVY